MEDDDGLVSDTTPNNTNRFRGFNSQPEDPKPALPRFQRMNIEGTQSAEAPADSPTPNRAGPSAAQPGQAAVEPNPRASVSRNEPAASNLLNRGPGPQPNFATTSAGKSLHPTPQQMNLQRFQARMAMTNSHFLRGTSNSEQKKQQEKKQEEKPKQLVYIPKVSPHRPAVSYQPTAAQRSDREQVDSNESNTQTTTPVLYTQQSVQPPKPPQQPSPKPAASTLLSMFVASANSIVQPIQSSARVAANNPISTTSQPMGNALTNLPLPTNIPPNLPASGPIFIPSSMPVSVPIGRSSDPPAPPPAQNPPSQHTTISLFGIVENQSGNQPAQKEPLLPQEANINRVLDDFAEGVRKRANPQIGRVQNASATQPSARPRQAGHQQIQVVSNQPSQQPNTAQQSLPGFTASLFNLKPNSASSEPSAPPPVTSIPKPQNSDAPTKITGITPIVTVGSQPGLSHTSLSRHSLSVFGQTEIKDLNETFIDNHSILKVVLEPPTQQICLSRRQMKRILHNFAHYLPGQQEEAEFLRLSSNSYCFNLNTFEQSQQRLFYRRVFESVILAVKNRYCCNSMIVVELLHMLIAQNQHSKKNPAEVLPWNRVEQIIKESPSQVGGFDYFEINAQSQAYELFVKELGSCMKVQKMILLRIFQNIHKRSALVDIMSKYLSRAAAFMKDSLKVTIDAYYKAEATYDPERLEVLRVDLEFIVRSLHGLVKDQGHLHFQQDVIYSLITYVSDVVIIIPDLQTVMLEVAIKLLRLDEIVSQMHYPQRPIDRPHFLKTHPHLLEYMKESAITMFSEIANVIDSVVNGRPSLAQSGSKIFRLRGDYWLEWLELWLHDRDFSKQHTLLDAGRVVVSALYGNARLFWLHFDSRYFIHTKTFIRKIFKKLDVHYSQIIQILHALLSSDKESFARNLIGQTNMLLMGFEQRNIYPFQELYEFSLKAPNFCEEFLTLVLEVAIWDPREWKELERMIEPRVNLTVYFVGALCSNQWKKPATYVSLVRAVNKLISETKTYEDLITEMLMTRPSKERNFLFEGPRFWCFEFLFATKSMIMSKPTLHEEMLEALNEHLDILLTLHETLQLNTIQEQRSNWLATIIEYMSVCRNTTVRDLYIILLHLPEIHDSHLKKLVYTPLNNITEDALLRYLLPAKNENFFGNLYANSVLTSFIFQAGNCHELTGLIDSLKILEQTLKLMSDPDKVTSQGWDLLQLFVILRDTLLSSTNSSLRPHMLILLSNLAVLDRSSLFLTNLREDAAVLALRVINDILYLSKEKNRYNRILFEDESYRKDIMLYGSEFDTLKTLLFAALQDRLKQRQAGYCDTLIFLGLLADKQPILANEMFVALKLRIESAILLSLDPNHHRIFEVGFSLIITISYHPNFRKMFDSIFQTDFYLDNLIKICITMYLRHSVSSPLLGLLCYFILEEFPKTPMLDKLVADNLTRIINPEVVKKLVNAVYPEKSVEQTKAAKLHWTDTKTIVDLNRSCLIGIPLPTPLLASQLCYEYWCRFSLGAFSSTLEERDRIALVIDPKWSELRLGMKQLACGLTKLKYPQPAFTVLASTITRLEDSDFAASVGQYMDAYLAARITEIQQLSYCTKALLLVIKTYSKVGNPSLESKMNVLIRSTRNEQLLLLQSCKDKLNPTIPNLLSEDFIKLLFRYIHEGSSSRLEMITIPMQEMIASLQANETWPIGYMIRITMFIHQYSDARMPLYENYERSTVHIVWCWGLLLLRQFAVSAQTEAQVLDKIEQAVTNRIKLLTNYHQKNEFIKEPIIELRSMAMVEQLNLLTSVLMTLFIKNRLQNSYGLVYKLALLIKQLPQPAQPISGYESKVSKIYADVKPSSLYNTLDFLSDRLMMEMLDIYSGMVLLLLRSNVPIPVESIDEFQLSIPHLMNKSASVLYRVSMSQPSYSEFAAKLPKKFTILSRMDGYLSTTHPHYTYGELMQLSTGNIHSAANIAVQYIRHQSKQALNMLRFRYFMHESVYTISDTYRGVFPQIFITKLADDMKNAANE